MNGIPNILPGNSLSSAFIIEEQLESLLTFRTTFFSGTLYIIHPTSTLRFKIENVEATFYNSPLTHDLYLNTY